MQESEYSYSEEEEEDQEQMVVKFPKGSSLGEHAQFCFWLFVFISECERRCVQYGAKLHAYRFRVSVLAVDKLD